MAVGAGPPLRAESEFVGRHAESAARLDGRLKVRIDRLDPTGMVVRSISTAVARTRAIPEGVGYAERQRIAYELVRELVDDLDAGLSANVRESYAELVRP